MKPTVLRSGSVIDGGKKTADRCSGAAGTGWRWCRTRHPGSRRGTRAERAPLAGDLRRGPPGSPTRGGRFASYLLATRQKITPEPALDRSTPPAARTGKRGDPARAFPHAGLDRLAGVARHAAGTPPPPDHHGPWPVCGECIQCGDDQRRTGDRCLAPCARLFTGQLPGSAARAGHRDPAWRGPVAVSCRLPAGCGVAGRLVPAVPGNPGALSTDPARAGGPAQGGAGFH